MAALSRFLPNPLYKLISVKLMHMGIPMGSLGGLRLSAGGSEPVRKM